MRQIRSLAALDPELQWDAGPFPWERPPAPVWLMRIAVLLLPRAYSASFYPYTAFLCVCTL